MIPGVKHVEGHAGYLARRIYQQVYGFTVADLAGILSRCVECNVTPRGQMDEQTAKAIVNQRVLGNPFIYEMGSRLLALKAYEIERLNRGFALLPISDRTINRLPGGEEHFRDMINFLGTFERGHSTYLLDRAADEVDWDHDFTKLILGRCVWDWVYQPCKGDLPAEYGEIWFH